MKKFNKKYYLTISCLYFFTNLSHQSIHIISNKTENFINEICKKYTRPFTCLILESEPQSNTLFTIAHTYNCICITVSPDLKSNIIDRCIKNNDNNIIVLKRTISPKLLTRFSECEHIDLIIAQDFLSNYSDQWENVVDSLKKFGDHLIIQVPKKSEIDEKISSYLGKNNTKVIEENDTTLSVYIKTHNPILLRGSFIRELRSYMEYKITSTFKEKYLIKTKISKNKSVKASWVPGISLITYCKLSGAYPSKETITNLIWNLKNTPHRDIGLYNIVLQGNNTKLIDVPFKEKPIKLKQKIKDLEKTIQRLHTYSPARQLKTWSKYENK